MFTRHRVRCGRAPGDIVAGEETWASLVATSAAQQWTVVQGLESGVTYEVKVIAGDDGAYCPETQSAVKRIQIDVKRGFTLTYLVDNTVPHCILLFCCSSNKR